MKHIYIGVNSVNNHLIVALVLTTSAYLFSLSAYSGTTSQTPVQLRVAITANNGHLNTNLFYSNIGKYNVSARFSQPLSLHICNVSGMKVAGNCREILNGVRVYPTIQQTGYVLQYREV
ncbi:MAG TPA: hypothetical protein VF008_16975 [Niastella sp.]